MKRLILILFIVPFIVNAQIDTLTLEYCYQKARENEPLLKQITTQQAISDIRMKKLNNTYLPQVFLNGQFSYQSDVSKIPIKIPTINIPEMDKDQYKATLDITQTLFDGGVMFQQKKLEKTSLDIEKQSIEIEFYKIKERINQLFFAYVIAKKTESILQLALSDLNTKLANLKAKQQNGIITISQVNSLKVETLKIEQQIIEVQSNCKATINILNQLCGIQATTSTYFKIEDYVNDNLSENINRPEMNYFSLQQNRLAQSEKLTNTQWFPRLALFGQLGYGKPALNMFSSSFDSYYMFGAKLSWNLWSWNQQGKDKKIIKLQSNIVNSQKEIFERNIHISQSKDREEISKYNAMLFKDDEIIALRSEIVNTAWSQVENGVLQTSDYINEQNALLQSKLNKEMHKIQYVMSIIQYKTNSGQIK